MATLTGTSGNDTIQAHGGSAGNLVIVASGSPADGNIYPIVNIWVNGTKVLANVTVNADHASGATQQIVVPVSGPVSTFAIEYTNDTQASYSTNQDRNVYLSSVALNGVQLDPATNATYDRTQNGAYYDTVHGQYDMVWGGSMNFSGSTVQSAGSSTGGGSTGSVTIDAGAGIDTVVYAGARTNYTISYNNDSAHSYAVFGGGNGDTLVNVERLAFGDSKVALDVNGDGGMAYRLYQAAFDRAPDAGGLGYWINTLDHGASLQAVAQSFMDSPEFQTKYGALANNQFVNQLYLNVLHRNADAGGQSYWTGHLDAHDLTRADVLAYFSESTENQAALIGTIQNGMVYV